MQELDMDTLEVIAEALEYRLKAARPYGAELTIRQEDDIKAALNKVNAEIARIRVKWFGPNA